MNHNAKTPVAVCSNPFAILYAKLIPAKRGAIAPIAALTLLAILMMAIVTLDSSRLIGANQKAKMVADAAALNAVSLIREQIDLGLQNNIDGAEIREVAEVAFREQVALHNLDLKNLTVEYKREGDNYIVDVNYEVQLPRILGNEKMVIKDSTSALTNYTESSTYMDIHLVVDLSASMSTGATLADQVDLWKVDGCAFACHADNVRRARDRRIALRQDKLAQALRALGTEAETALDEFDLEADSTKFNIWAFNHHAWSMGQTTSINRFKTLADSVNNRIPSGGTNIAHALNWVRVHKLPESGDGFSADSRKTFVFLITDGIADRGPLTRLNHHRGVVDLRYCDLIKQKDAVLGVIYTKYEDYSESYEQAWGSGRSNVGRWGRWNHRSWINHYNRYAKRTVESISGHMRQCASQDFYMETESPAELNAALKKLYENAIKKTKGEPRLSS